MGNQERPVHRWTPQQESIFDWFQNPQHQARPHLIIDARAGSSKTTTLLEGALRAPEASTFICAYNKKIAKELEDRLPDTIPGRRVIHSSTMHSIGFSIVRFNWWKATLNPRRDEEMVRKVLGEKAPYKLIKAIVETTQMVKEVCPLASTVDDILMVGEDFDTLLTNYDKKDEVEQAKLVLKTLEALKEPSTEIAYSDMVWLPVVQPWIPQARYKLIIVDEAQDMSPVQLLLAQKLSVGRMAFVGDRYQTIYGFRGADHFSLPRLQKELDADRRPLTVSFRCARSIIEHAQQIVPDIEAMPTAPEGNVDWIYEDALQSRVTPGCFILARLNAPLASTCLRLRRAGVPARIEGADTMQKVRKVFEKLHGDEDSDVSTSAFMEKARIWMLKELATAKALKSPMREERAVDIGTMLMTLAKQAHTVKEIKETLASLFKGKSPDDIICMTVHKAKGLEADRVFLLRESFPQYRLKSVRSEDYELRVSTEEKNIEYVAITRARKELIWVSAPPRDDAF